MGLVGAAAAFVASRPLTDNSFLTHLATGRLILADGVPDREPVPVHGHQLPGAELVVVDPAGGRREGRRRQPASGCSPRRSAFAVGRGARPADPTDDDRRRPATDRRGLLADRAARRPGAVLRVPVPQRPAAPGRLPAAGPGAAGVERGALAVVAGPASSRCGSTCTARGSTASSCSCCSGVARADRRPPGASPRPVGGRRRRSLGSVLGGALYPRAFEILLLPTRQFGDPVEREALQAYREWARVSLGTPMLWALFALGAVALVGAVRQRRWASAGVVVAMVVMGWSGARLVPIAAVSLVPFAAASLRGVGTLGLAHGAAVRRCWAVTAGILVAAVAATAWSCRATGWTAIRSRRSTGSRSVDWSRATWRCSRTTTSATTSSGASAPGERLRRRSARCGDTGPVPHRSCASRTGGRTSSPRSIPQVVLWSTDSPLTAELSDSDEWVRATTAGELHRVLPDRHRRSLQLSPRSSALSPASARVSARRGRRSGELQSRRQMSWSGPLQRRCRCRVGALTGAPPVGGGLVRQGRDRGLDPHRQRPGVLALGSPQRLRRC